MNKSHILWGCLGLLTLTSCFKDEAPNAECDIVQAWIHADEPSAMFYQASDSLVYVISDKTDIRFTVRRKADITALAPHFAITPGAVMTPANGSVHDFSQGPVVYRVTSEDGAWHRDYTVSVVPVTQTVSDEYSYDFENYRLNSKNKYYVWSDEEHGVMTDIWASGNGGFNVSNSNAAPLEYPTIPLEKGFEGNAVRLVTRKTGALAQTLNKRIAAGNLFLGEFDPLGALQDPLNATRFGRPFDKRPKQLSGYYRYTPGPTFQNVDGSPVEGKKDVADIYAIFYRNHDGNGNAVTLNGADIQSSPLIVAKAIMSEVPPTTEWTPFSVDFTYLSEIDLDLLENRGYSLAIVFSSSADGAYFQGAIGSTLDIDKVRLICETQE